MQNLDMNARIARRASRLGAVLLVVSGAASSLACDSSSSEESEDSETSEGSGESEDGDGSSSSSGTTGGEEDTTGEDSTSTESSTDATGDDTDTDTEAGTDGGAPAVELLSAYYGLDALPATATALCGVPVGGEDGMPVVFSAQVDDATLDPEDFIVETQDGEELVPLCATLNPANEALELHTVLLAGPFGTAQAQPVAVEVVGVLDSVDARPLQGLRIEDITPLEDGPSLVFAQRFEPDTPGLAGECPEGTLQVVQLTWQGGVTGPGGAALGEAQRLGVSVGLEGGGSAIPIALADDDPDNYVLACLDVDEAAVFVSVAPGLFHDPGDDENPETMVGVE
ncbi:hypothetical protein G6O69_33200 [Pseudenhygromyxa sp. WMMC2535]|uniref:hypothetical protein n=1 Tax=Pseudenhygromyxa sp. WMMC2535 TaxID=2712867 RepID=UPI001551F61F|nr:hypothetical protein [Pseudenhygromyxa sp. WMMC2535]NVB42726.1 hypothetical protein [Pseudenhygromyxa sp. WMMC2535]